MSRYEIYSERYADMKDARLVVENPDHKVLSITYDTEQDLEHQPHEPIIPSVTFVRVCSRRHADGQLLRAQQVAYQVGGCLSVRDPDAINLPFVLVQPTFQ